MSNAMVLVWNRAIPGRESDANELFGQTVGFWGKQQKAGTIESFEPVLLGAHGGTMNGFFLVRGQPEKLDALLHTDEMLDIVVRANTVLDGFGVVRAYTGPLLMDVMQRWAKQIKK